MDLISHLFVINDNQASKQVSQNKPLLSNSDTYLSKLQEKVITKTTFINRQIN